MWCDQDDDKIDDEESYQNENVKNQTPCNDDQLKGIMSLIKQASKQAWKQVIYKTCCFIITGWPIPFKGLM